MDLEVLQLSLLPVSFPLPDCTGDHDQPLHGLAPGPFPLGWMCSFLTVN